MFRSASRALKACSRISLLRADAWQIFECEQLMPWTCRGFRNFRWVLREGNITRLLSVAEHTVISQEPGFL